MKGKTYKIYPIIQIAPVANIGINDTSPDAGSIDPPFDSDGGNKMVIRKGSFIISFSDSNFYSDQGLNVFTFDQQTSLGTERKKQLNLLISQMQYGNFSTGQGISYLSDQLLSSKTYDLRIGAYTSGTSSYIVKSSNEFYYASQAQFPMTSHYYPIDFQNCLLYDAATDEFQFDLVALLDNNSNVINCNTIFKGVYTLL